MTKPLENKKVAFVATDGFEPSELQRPLKELRQAGADCIVISPGSGSIKGWKKEWTDEVPVNLTLDEATPDAFDALVIPGGTLNCDKLRTNKKAVAFVRKMFQQQKPISAICHGPQLLIEADVVKNRRLTSYPAIKTDLMNAGAEWVDAACVCADGLVTSRDPGDLDEFITKTIEEINEGLHHQRAAA